MQFRSVQLIVATLAATACGRMSSVDGPTAGPDSPAVLAVLPAAGAQSIDPSAPIVITFSRPMMAGMEASVVLHEGTVAGSPVAGTAVWSGDRTMLTFTPGAPLKPRTTYVLHMSPGLLGQNGQAINLRSCTALGGQTVTAGMMGTSATGGMMNGTWGSGMMGNGWRAGDGTFGMYFTFTTS